MLDTKGHQKLLVWELNFYIQLLYNSLLILQDSHKNTDNSQDFKMILTSIIETTIRYLSCVTFLLESLLVTTNKILVNGKVCRKSDWVFAPMSRYIYE